MSTRSEDRNGVAPHFKLFGFGFLPVVLVAVLSRQSDMHRDDLSISVMKNTVEEDKHEAGQIEIYI